LAAAFKDLGSPARLSFQSLGLAEQIGAGSLAKEIAKESFPGVQDFACDFLVIDLRSKIGPFVGKRHVVPRLWRANRTLPSLIEAAHDRSWLVLLQKSRAAAAKSGYQNCKVHYLPYFRLDRFGT
jgi:hypothetical protein